MLYFFQLSFSIYTMRIATWNIAGNQTYPEKQEEPEYFVNSINKIDPDILLLQEVHFKDDYSFSKKYFQNYPYIFDSEVSPSHNNPEFRLGLSILSKHEIINEHTVTLLNPNLTKVLSNKKIIKSHEKAVQICSINGINIANIQLLPLHVFGTTYDNEEGFTRELEDQLLQLLVLPTIFAGDFNHKEPQKIFPRLFSKLNLKDCLPGEPTFVYHSTNPDHIYLPKSIKCINSKIIKSLTDHYLCITDIEG